MSLADVEALVEDRLGFSEADAARAYARAHAARFAPYAALAAARRQRQRSAVLGALALIASGIVLAAVVCLSLWQFARRRFRRSRGEDADRLVGGEAEMI